MEQVADFGLQVGTLLLVVTALAWVVCWISGDPEQRDADDWDAFNHRYHPRGARDER